MRRGARSRRFPGRARRRTRFAPTESAIERSSCINRPNASESTGVQGLVAWSARISSGRGVIGEKRVDAVGIRLERGALVLSSLGPVASCRGGVTLSTGLAIHRDGRSAEDLGEPPFRRAPAQFHLK